MKKKVCVLGSGLVSRPAIEYLSKKKNIDLTVASLNISDIDSVTDGISNFKKLALNVKNRVELKELLTDQEVVISLLPASMHPLVARAALKTNTHFACTSYLSDRIKEINSKAEAAGLIFINECGMDPGLDHMSAMSLINKLKQKNYTIRSFESYGSGIPAPQDNNNPLGYKFSWTPKGVLLATRNEAIFQRDDQILHFFAGTIFNCTWDVDVPELGILEAYPNRNSLKYTELYGLNGISTLVRGTLRNPGWGKIMRMFYHLGLLNEIEFKNTPDTYRALFNHLTEKYLSTFSKRELIVHLQGIYGKQPVAALKWLGLLDDAPLNVDMKNSIDIIALVMAKKMAYLASEKDMIIIYHVVKAENAKGEMKEFTSKLVSYGTPGGNFAMASTVSLPVAIAAELIINKKITKPGVHIPTIPELYEPILNGLEKNGVVVEEAL